jgi:two-component system, cell cycle sensor histidine kinase and response regulator CckA
MKNRSDERGDLESLQKKLAGFGEFSVRKTYYPELQRRLDELERFKAFIDHSHDAIFLVEVPTGRIVDVNDSASRQLGWDRDELMERSLLDLFTGEEGAKAVQLIQSPAQQGGDRALEVVYLLQKEGGRLPVELTLDRMRFQDRAYVLAVGRDITERMHLQEQLLQAQKMEAVGRLAGGVAHDFNNILMVILGFGSMLAGDESLEPRHKEKVAQIMTAAERAAQLTSSLLTFSRKQVMKLSRADLNEVVLQMERFLARIIGEDISLSSSLAAGEIFANVDRGQIEQVLANLATNARDAMPRGGVLRIETSRQTVDELFVQANKFGEPGAYAVISVSDTGIGMDEKTRTRIFEPFFTTKETGKGTGLGMSIVYGIIKQHNGFINVYSEPGVGTTFRIYLPFSDAPGADEELPAGAEPPRGGTETILVAEDEPDLRGLLEGLLTDYGYRVILAEDGLDAVEKFRNEPGKIGLVLMDMIMPRMSGKEAFDAIRKLDPEVRVAYTSGYTSDIIKSRDVLDEGTELIMKPVQPMELLRRIRAILDL